MLKKCPICELNYIHGNEKMCKVCAAERSRRRAPKADEEIIMCSECGEKITDDRCWVFGDVPICDECAERNYRKYTADVVQW